jgi:hypothetical protein
MEGGVGEEVIFGEGNTIPSHLANEKGLAFPAGLPVSEADPENRATGISYDWAGPGCTKPRTQYLPNESQWKATAFRI